MNVGKYIKNIRLEKRLTQQDLADKMKSSKSYVSQVETGETNLTVESLERFARALGMKLNEKLFL